MANEKVFVHATDKDTEARAMTLAPCIWFCEICENHHQFESVPEIKEWVICSMHTLFIKYYDAKYKIKSENYFFLSSQVFI